MKSASEEEIAGGDGRVKGKLGREKETDDTILRQRLRQSTEAETVLRQS